MPGAAREGDLIGHAPPIPPVTAGAIVGAALGIAGSAKLGSGGLVSSAVAGARAASGAAAAVGGGGGAGGVVTGLIVPRCSGNVFTNGIPAARALIDKAACSLHPPVPLPIVSGSSNVFINGVPAARLGDKIFCGAVILTASGNVFIGGSAGGESVSTDMNLSESSKSPLMLEGLLVADSGASSISYRQYETFANWHTAAPLWAGGTWGKISLDEFDNPITGRKNRILAQARLDVTEERMRALEKKGFKLSAQEQLEYAKLNSLRNTQAGSVDQIDRQLRQVTPFNDWTSEEWHRTNEAALMTLGGLGAAKAMGGSPRIRSGNSPIGPGRAEFAGGIEEINSVGFGRSVNRSAYTPEGRVIEQHLPDSCVAAACRIRISDAGIDVPEAYLRADLKWVAGEGTSFRNIPETLAIPENGGISATFSRDTMRLRELQESIDKGGSAIVNINGHAVVVDKIAKGTVSIRDPLNGAYGVSTRDFLKAWRNSKRIVVTTNQ